MLWIRRGVFAILLLIVAVFLHWSLPSHDVVRILGTDVVRMNVETTDSEGRDATRSHDMRLINATTPSGETRVYRNEDTGWGWPPYFKFDSANLAAEAADMVSTDEDPKWVVVTHYGFRWSLFSMFPNAIGLEPAETPDQYVAPWTKIIAILLALGALITLRRYILFRLGGEA